MKKPSVLIVEPSAIVREGLGKILRDSGDFELTPSLSEADGLASAITKEKPDIVVVNPTVLPYVRNMSTGDGDAEYLLSDMSEYLTDDCSPTVVALVYQYIDPQSLRRFPYVIDIREARTRIPQILREATETGYEPSKARDSGLSKREKDVLVLVAKGLMNKEIADRLNISIHTVITHRKNITRKTNIKTVAGLTMYALMNNMIDEFETQQ